MKFWTSFVGTILIIIGIITLAYRGYTYTTQEKVAEIGPIKVTSEKEKTVNFPPYLGGLCLVAGVVLIIVARSGRINK